MPAMRDPRKPFQQIVNVEKGDEDVSDVVDHRPFSLTTPWQREMISSLGNVTRSLENVQQGQATLEGGQAKLFLGQSELTEAFGRQKAAFDALVPRVDTIEKDARWRVWAIGVLRAASPVVALLVGRYLPEIAKVVQPILDAISKTAQ
jgi:hypothetical protein